jgi:hypothetical protein
LRKSNINLIRNEEPKMANIEDQKENVGWLSMGEIQRTPRFVEI